MKLASVKTLRYPRACRRVTAWLPVALAATIVACANPATPSAVPSNTASATEGTPRRVVLIGQPIHLDRAFQLVEDLDPEENVVPGPSDIVLFAMGALDGPMPTFREHVEAMRGTTHGDAAILLVDAAQQDDPELIELVLIETRNLLQQNRIRDSMTMPVIRDDDANFDLLIRGLLAGGAD
jgi:hypothetical protein